MKEFLMIENGGQLDTRAITLVGASNKRGSDSAIGMFGSGFSYTVGTLLRRGLEFHIFSGQRKVQITTKLEDFRGEPINVIYVDGERTSLTAEIGPKWTETECIREVWSNAMDEGDAKRQTVFKTYDSALGGRTGFTRVYIEVNAAIRLMLANWKHFFIDVSEAPLFKGKSGSVFPVTPERPARFYRRGVWCTEDANELPAFCYNLNEVNLPESRTIATGAAMWQAADLISEMIAPEIVSHLLMESQRRKVPDIRQIYNGSKMAEALKADLVSKGYQFIGDKTTRNKVGKDLEAVTFWCDNGANAVELSQLTGLQNVLSAVKPKKIYQEVIPDMNVRWAVEKMVKQLKKADIDIDEFPIVYGILPENVIAHADMEDNKIVLSEHATRNENLLFKSLIEEYIHLKFRVADLTVEQQHAYLAMLYAAVMKLV